MHCISAKTHIRHITINPIIFRNSYIKHYICAIYINIMPEEKEDYSFWVKYKRFAGTEIIMYLLMIIGIGLGIILLS